MFWRFEFPSFPKKWVISGPSVVEERRFMFDYYLKNVFRVRVIQQSDIVERFLKLDKGDEQKSEHTSSYRAQPNNNNNQLNNGQAISTLQSQNTTSDENKSQKQEENQDQTATPPIKIEQKTSVFEPYFSKNILPIAYYDTNGYKIIPYEVPDNNSNISETLDFILKKLDISKDLVSLHCELFAIFKIDEDFNKIEKVNYNEIKIEELIKEKQPLAIGRWGKINDTDIEAIKSASNKGAQNLLVNELLNDSICYNGTFDNEANQELKNLSQKYLKAQDPLPTFSTLSAISNSSLLFNSISFLPCTCDLRQDGSLMQIILTNDNVTLRLLANEMKLVISWSFVKKFLAKNDDGKQVFRLEYQKPEKAVKILNFETKQNLLIEKYFEEFSGK